MGAPDDRPDEDGGGTGGDTDARPASARILPPALALLTVVVLSLAASLALAIVLVGMILWHEYGHVRSARRVGVRSRGIYLIPFVGGIAALDSLGSTREQQMRIALGGPLYGLHLCGLALLGALVFESGGTFRFALVIWAGLNLINLAPVHPLDGGRIAHALAHTVHPFAGLLVSGVGAAALAALSLTLLPPFFLLVAVLGGVEFFVEYRLYQRAREVVDRATETGGDGDQGIGEHEALAVRLITMGRMRGGEALRYLFVYVALTLAYLALLAVAMYSPRLEQVAAQWWELGWF